MRKIITLAMAVLVVCLLFTACNCEHQYAESITKEPSCTEVGVKTFTCTQCSISYTEEIPMIEHTFGKESVSKKATCTEEGEKSVTCTVCNFSKVTGTVTKVKHNYTSKVTTAATCTAEGVKTYTCTECGDSYTKSISKEKHSYTSKVTKDATCTADGVMTYTCKNCNNSYTEKISPKGHSYSTQTTQAATCTAAGSQKHTCKTCGYSYFETVNATGHNWVNATCTKAKYCSHCNTTSGSALGHTTQNGTCERCGVKISIADQCKLTVKNDLPCTITSYYSTGHFWSRVKIEEIQSEFDVSYDGSLTLELYISGYIEAVRDDMAVFDVKLYDSKGRLIDADGALKTYAYADMYTTFYCSFDDLEPGEYAIEFAPRT